MTSPTAVAGLGPGASDPATVEIVPGVLADADGGFTTVTSANPAQESTSALARKSL